MQLLERLDVLGPAKFANLTNESKISTGAQFPFMPLGMISAFGAATAPSGWLLCNGAAVSRVTYALLFAVIGTTFGAGDGSTTFNVPDLRQRFPIGKATSGTGSTLGGTGGNIDHTHTGTSDSGGGHDHDVAIGVTGGNFVYSTRHGTSQSGSATYTTVTAVGGTASDDELTSTSSDGDHTHTFTTGSGNPPFQAVNYIVFSGV